MTDYDWQRMAHDLATEVMGWEKSHYDCGCWYLEHSPGFAIRGLSGCDDGDCLNLSQCYLWKPWLDLNQAWMLFDALGNECDGVMFEVYSNSDATHWYAQASAEGHGYDNHKDPAKAIMLAVAKASELNLTDYEVEDG